MGVAVFKQTTTFGKGNLIRRDSSRNVHRGGNDLKSKSRYVLPLSLESWVPFTFEPIEPVSRIQYWHPPTQYLFLYFTLSVITKIEFQIVGTMGKSWIPRLSNFEFWPQCWSCRTAGSVKSAVLGLFTENIKYCLCLQIWAQMSFLRWVCDLNWIVCKHTFIAVAILTSLTTLIGTPIVC